MAGVRLKAFFTVRFAAFLAGVRLTAFFTVRFAAFLVACVLLAVFVALRLAAPVFVVPVLALAGLPRRFEPDLTLPTTLREPILGANVDSSPVDHFTRKRDPITPVTTPSRGAWPTFVDATCTRSPMSAICTSLVAGIRNPHAVTIGVGTGPPTGSGDRSSCWPYNRVLAGNPTAAVPHCWSSGTPTVAPDTWPRHRDPSWRGW